MVSARPPAILEPGPIEVPSPVQEGPKVVGAGVAAGGFRRTAALRCAKFLRRWSKGKGGRLLGKVVEDRLEVHRPPFLHTRIKRHTQSNALSIQTERARHKERPQTPFLRKHDHETSPSPRLTRSPLPRSSTGPTVCAKDSASR